MKQILLVAHDPGGANILSAGAPALRALGHSLTWAAGGPALRLWQDAGERPVAVDDPAIDALVARTAPDLLLTGTSGFADLERHAWAAGRRHRVGSLAVIDAWMNYRRRVVSRTSGALVLPDAFAVADEAMRRGLLAEDVQPSRVHVVGQPHLEAVTARLAVRRRSRASNDRPVLVFFSEHIFEERNAGGCPGYDQFTVASVLLDALRSAATVNLVILPHPVEGPDRWTSFLAARNLDQGASVALGGMDRDTALATADGVVGMTSMVLIEASLVGVPTLSLQLGRKVNANPMIDDFPEIHIVTTAIDVPRSLEKLLKRQDRSMQAPERDFMRGAARRLAQAVAEELGRRALGG